MYTIPLPKPENGDIFTARQVHDLFGYGTVHDLFMKWVRKQAHGHGEFVHEFYVRRYLAAYPRVREFVLGRLNRPTVGA